MTDIYVTLDEHMKVKALNAELLEAAQAFADAARPNIYPCPDKPNSLSGKLQALDDAIAKARNAQ